MLDSGQAGRVNALALWLLTFHKAYPQPAGALSNRGTGRLWPDNVGRRIGGAKAKERPLSPDVRLIAADDQPMAKPE